MVNRKPSPLTLRFTPAYRAFAVLVGKHLRVASCRQTKGIGDLLIPVVIRISPVSGLQARLTSVMMPVIKAGVPRELSQQPHLSAPTATFGSRRRPFVWRRRLHSNPFLFCNRAGFASRRSLIDPVLVSVKFRQGFLNPANAACFHVLQSRLCNSLV